MFCLQIVSSDEEDIENIPKMLLEEEAIAVWSEVTPSGGGDDALLAAMPADWAAPLHPIARAPSVAGTTDPGSDAVPGTPPDSPEPPDSPVDPVDTGSQDPSCWFVCTNFRYGRQCGAETNGSSQFCRSCQLGL